MHGARALKWVSEENKRTLTELTADLRYQRYYQTVIGIAKSSISISAPNFGGDGWVYDTLIDAHHPRGLMRRASEKSYLLGNPNWESLIDIDDLAKSENRNWTLPSLFLIPHSSRALLALSDGGDRHMNQREFDLQTKQFVAHGWQWPSSRSFIQPLDATRALILEEATAEPSRQVLKLWLHGQDLATAKEIFRGSPGEEVLYLPLFSHRGTATQAIVSSAGEAGQSFWLLDKQLATQKIEMLPPHSNVRGVYRDQLIFSIDCDWEYDRQKWPKDSLLSIALSDIDRSSTTVRLALRPEPNTRLGVVRVLQSGVLAMSTVGALDRAMLLSFDGSRWQTERIPLPNEGTLTIAGFHFNSDFVLFSYEDFLHPQTLYEWDMQTKQVREFKRRAAQFDANRYVAERLWTTSRDGTAVPYFFVHSKDLKPGTPAATILHGYGGSGVSSQPTYSGSLGKLWLDHGGVFAVANIRGGGEFGLQWMRDGEQPHLQNRYDDFVAVAEDLIRRKITSPRRLGIEGFSNGGHLMGVVLNQRPELFHAAAIGVPVLDLLRFLQGGLGSVGTQFRSEFGSPDAAEERAFIDRISPYQNLRRRADFPAPFIFDSTTDDQTGPGNSRKYAAKLANLGMPYFYYEHPTGGHDLFIEDRLDNAQITALKYVYFSRQLMN